MKIATWNVNSIRARFDRLLDLLERHRPDVLCIQETKVIDADFPAEALARAGYQSAFYGQKTYNGVAILAREAPQEVSKGFGDGLEEPQARLIAASVAGVRFVNVYVPNGQEVGHEKYDYKLGWLDRLQAYLEKNEQPDVPMVLCGDFNIAPGDLDVYDPVKWDGQIFCSDPERSRLRKFLAWGLTDAFRHLHPDIKEFSWWDYRQLGFPKNRGLRIDLLLLSPPALQRCTGCLIDRDERKGEGPSDHAPVLAELAMEALQKPERIPPKPPRGAKRSSKKPSKKAAGRAKRPAKTKKRKKPTPQKAARPATKKATRARRRR